MLASYRRTGADLPFGDPRGYHGLAFEGYFWRITHAQEGWVIVALAGVNRTASGDTWGTVGLAGHPGGAVRSAAVGGARAGTRGIDVRAEHAGRPVLQADAERVRMDLGHDARLDLHISEPDPWPRRAFGGVGPAHVVPGLSQYWHPYLLGGRASGTARLGDREWRLDGASVYAEKNWGRGGFPAAWWWGQAHAFAREDVCVAFAGGRAGVGSTRLHVTATSVVVRVGEELIHLVRPFVPVRVGVDDDGWRLAGRTARHRVEIVGHANGTAPHLLPVPLPGERRNLEGAAAQHLAGHVTLRVRRGSHTVFEGESPLAGLERGAT